MFYQAQPAAGRESPRSAVLSFLTFAAVVFTPAPLTAQTPPDAKTRSREILNLGVQAFKAGNYADSVDYFQKVVILDPDFSTARLYLGTAYMSRFIPGGSTPENRQYAMSALEQFETVLQLNPSELVATQSIASIHFNLKDWDKAEEWNRKVIALDSNNKEAYYTLGVVAWTRFLPVDRQARKDLSMTLEQPGPLKDNQTRASLRAQWMPILDEGIRDESEALRIDPEYEHAMAYMNLLIRYRADLLDSAADYEQAIDQADEWVQKTLAAQRKNAAKAAAAQTGPGVK